MNVTRFLACSILLSGFLLSTGCGSLSLFSDRHVHYHASPEADKKIADLEKRVETLEKKTADSQK